MTEAVANAVFLRSRAGKEEELAGRLEALVLASRSDPGVMIYLGERHLRRILKNYVNYYNISRPHLSLERNAPVPRSIEPPAFGVVVAVPQVGGLHHPYTRAA